MPLPILFMGAAAITGIFGAEKTFKAFADNHKAGVLNTSANEGVDHAKNKLEVQRANTAYCLQELGNIKVDVLADSVTDFVQTFEQIKNVDFQNSVGLEELKNLHIDASDFEELKELGNFAVEVAGGAVSGAASGALTAFGAYGAATAFAHASTGTAISTLSGIAAHNATFAFFGGGALSAGGLGVAGGTVVLGSLIVGPALMVMGLVTGAKCQEKLDQALANQAQANEIMESLNTASDQCAGIRRRTMLFYDLLTHLDTYLRPQVWKMKDIIQHEGTDYRAYSEESKNAIIQAVSTAGTIKAVLDTPILNEDGALTKESEEITNQMKKLIYKD